MNWQACIVVAKTILSLTGAAGRRNHPMLGRSLCLVLFLTRCGAAAAAEPALPQDDRLSAPEGPVTVTAIVDGDTVVLADGRQVRLIGLQAPKLPLGREGFEAWPHAAQAKAALVEVINGREAYLHFGGLREDRYGRVLAQMERADGLWVQGEMLRRGMARVYTFPDNRALAAPMLRLEAEARAAGRGIWDLVFYRIRRPDALERMDFYEIVEARVHETASVGGRVYVNFGPDYRTDFTLSLPSRERNLFVKAGKDPLALTGQMVRVRGWVYYRNGPMIDLTHPEQLEIIEPKSDTP
mgnify:CR=1 FL=1